MQFGFRHVKAFFMLQPGGKPADWRTFKLNNLPATKAHQMLMLRRLFYLIVAARLSQPYFGCCSPWMWLSYLVGSSGALTSSSGVLPPCKTRLATLPRVQWLMPDHPCADMAIRSIWASSANLIISSAAGPALIS